VPAEEPAAELEDEWSVLRARELVVETDAVLELHEGQGHLLGLTGPEV
jgi:hypothetical protein